MSLPNVLVNITNGNLGLAGSNEDGVAGLISSGVATTQMPLLTPKVIFGTQDLIALGVTSESNPGLVRHVQEFYTEGREGQELWIMTVAATVSMEDISDKTKDYAKKLLNAANGRIHILGITRTPSESYTPVINNGLDVDSYNALTKADDLCSTFAASNSPLRALIEARSFSGNEVDLEDLHTRTNNRAGLVLLSTVNDGSSSVGLVLGRMAGNPVQRKISRVKDGALPVTSCYAGNKDIDTYNGVSLIHDKGFITARTFFNKSGFYISDDPTATALTDDYSSFSNGRVIDKAHRIAYDVYVNELNDEVPVTADGKINPGTLKSLEAKIITRTNLDMAGEISAFNASIDPDQNVISLGKIVIKLSVTPVGYNKNIQVDLGFSNPSLN